VTASAGSATIADGRLSALELLGAADGAMYAAKRSGRNRAAHA
jgi:PleD family two-component response regulator